MAICCTAGYAKATSVHSSAPPGVHCAAPPSGLLSSVPGVAQKRAVYVPGAANWRRTHATGMGTGPDGVGEAAQLLFAAYDPSQVNADELTATPTSPAGH